MKEKSIQSKSYFI